MIKEIEEDRKSHKATARECYLHRLSASVGCDPCIVAISSEVKLSGFLIC